MQDIKLTLGARAKQINQININNQVNQISYTEARNVITRLPFKINPNFYGAVAKHLHRMGADRFYEYAAKALECGYNKERYFMKCLKNDELNKRTGQ